MKRTTIRELKHETSRVLERVAAGETIEVCRRNEPVAILSPPARKTRVIRPDFAARLRAIYGTRLLPTTGAELVSESRGES
jgi:prevent-host-death family protein